MHLVKRLQAVVADADNRAERHRSHSFENEFDAARHFKTRNTLAADIFGFCVLQAMQI